MEHTTDVDELKTALKFKSRAEVFRTLDKLAMRKDFHRALADAGLSMDSLAGKYKVLMESDSEKIQLGALVALSKAIGVDKYEVIDEGARDWEETLLKITEKEREQKVLGVPAAEEADYEVVVPQTPVSVQLKQAEEKKLGQEIYDTITRTKNTAAEPVAGS